MKPFGTCADLVRDLVAIGVGPGDVVMAHASMRAVGPLIGGPDTLVAALREAIGADGTLVVATDWHAPYLEADLLDAGGCVPPEWRGHIPPFDPTSSRAMRDNGALAEFVRTTPGALRSGNAGCSVAAIGARAAWLVADQPLDYGHGPGSPMAKLVEAGGKVLMIGAPLDTITLLHHAEHLADVPGKRVVRFEAPYAASGGAVWRMTEEYESTEAIVAGLPDDYFVQVIGALLATGAGKRGHIHNAASLLLDAAQTCTFAIRWIEAALASD